MDRAPRIAAYCDVPDYEAIWKGMGEKIKANILANGWDPEFGAFAQACGEPHLDAATF